MQQLNGRVTLVTGGARGLGREIVRVLATEGANVVAADVRHEMAEEAAGELRAAGCSVTALAMDVSDPASVDEGFARIERDLGPVSILVNDAAIDITVPVEELAVEDWQRIVAVNLSGAFLCAKRAIPAMREAGTGSIVNIASTAAKRAWPNASGYHATKWGLLGLSHALHAELRPHGIKVTAIVTGGMRTPFLLDRFPDIDPGVLQDPRNVAETVKFALLQPAETVIPELMVLPMRETSWP